MSSSTALWLNCCVLCLFSRRQQHPSQASTVCFICRDVLIFHSSPTSFRQCFSALLKGLRILRASPTPIPNQLWSIVHILTWPSSASTSAARYSSPDRSGYSKTEMLHFTVSVVYGNVMTNVLQK